VDRFYNNLQERGDCQSTRKSHKSLTPVGWVVGRENHARAPARFG